MEGSPEHGRGSGYRRPTIADVARESGVSVAAASYALNGLPGVSEASRARVMAAAKAVHFHPNSLARSLRQGMSPVLGLLLADIANPYYPEIASGVISEASSRNHQVFLTHTGLRNELEASAVAALLSHRCAGLIFTSVVEAGRSIIEDLLDRGVPFVQVVRRLDSLPADFVGIDDQSAAREIATHLLSYGRERPVILNGPAESSASRDRLAGYRHALDSDSVVPLHPELLDGELTRESGYIRATVALEAGDTLPDAFICGNDMIALGAMDAVSKQGLRIPRDVAIVGYDDMAFASSPLLALTTVRVPRQEMGRAAIRALFERMADPTLPPRTFILPHRLVVRRTCGKPTVPNVHNHRTLKEKGQLQ